MIDPNRYPKHQLEEHQLPSILDELCDAQLGDKRRVERMLDIVGRLQDDPSQSFPESTKGDDAALKGLYRFFSNSAVTMAAQLKPHLAATSQRMEAVGRCFAVHDTTELSFETSDEKHTREGLEEASRHTRRLRLHPTLMVAAGGSRLPLGLGAMMSWARTEQDKQTHPDGWSEPDRWHEQALAIEQQAGEQNEVIHLMDRGADSFDVLSTLRDAEARFVIRMKHDRKLADTDDGETITDAFDGLETLGKRTIEIGKRGTNRAPSDKKKHPPRDARDATVCVRSTSVTLPVPRSATKTDSPLLELNVVEVKEPAPPDDEDSVVWYLLTTEPVDSAEQCWEVVDAYCTRWTIEEYFHALKTGCAVEQRQLQSRDALEAMLGMMLPMAWRMLLMRHLPRIIPDASATILFSDTELEVLREVKPNHVPDQPTLRQACQAMAALGGYLISRRKNPPGWKTLWRGLRRLRQRHEGYLVGLRRSGQR